MVSATDRELALRQVREARERLQAEPSPPRFQRRLLERRLSYWLGVLEHADARAARSGTGRRPAST